MKPKTELLLYQLMWFAEQAFQPTLRNMSESFEGWAYRSGLLRSIQRLEALDLLETQGKSLARVIRLTERGRRLIEGSRDPEEKWGRQWDGIWRLVVFDVPEGERKLRLQLRRRLKELHFGCLQRSVWISADPVDNLAKLLKGARKAPAVLTVMESRVVGGYGGREMAESAWEFERINAAYETYLGFLKRWRKQHSTRSADDWLAEERALWTVALDLDPLLPSALLPKGYLGKKAFRNRRKALPTLLKPHGESATKT